MQSVFAGAENADVFVSVKKCVTDRAVADPFAFEFVKPSILGASRLLPVAKSTALHPCFLSSEVTTENPPSS